MQLPAKVLTQQFRSALPVSDQNLPKQNYHRYLPLFRRVSDTNVSVKQLCSPVAVITGPWNCVVYRDIRLLKANSCSRHFSSNCVGDAAPKRSSGCCFMLVIKRQSQSQSLIDNAHKEHGYIHNKIHNN